MSRHLVSRVSIIVLIYSSSQVEFWPASFVVEVMGHRPLLAQLTEWLKSNKPPMCMFMPDRLADQAAHRANQAAFESLATALGQSQTVSSPDREADCFD